MADMYCWVVVVAAFTVTFLVDGILYTFGVLLVSLTEELKESVVSVATLGGLFSGFIAISAACAGSLSDDFGRRPISIIGAILFASGLFASSFASNITLLYFTYGLLCGAGYGLMLPASTACVLEHFEESQRGLACGLALCGSGLGGFVMNVVTQNLLEEFGLRGTFLLLSGIMLNGIPCGLIFHQPQTPIKVSETDRQSPTFVTSIKNIFVKILLQNNVAIFRDFQCLCFLLSTFVFGLGYYAPLSFLPKQAMALELGKEKAAWLLSAFGLANTIGRVALGWFGNRRCIHRTALLKVLVLIMALSFPTSVLLSSFEAKLLFSCTYGILVGGYIVSLPLALAEEVSADRFGKTTGLFTTMISFGVLIGSPMNGWTIDATGDYIVCYSLAGSEILLALLILMLPAIRRICCTKRKSADITHL